MTTYSNWRRRARLCVIVPVVQSVGGHFDLHKQSEQSKQNSICLHFLLIGEYASVEPRLIRVNLLLHHFFRLRIHLNVFLLLVISLRANIKSQDSVVDDFLLLGFNYASHRTDTTLHSFLCEISLLTLFSPLHPHYAQRRVPLLFHFVVALLSLLLSPFSLCHFVLYK